MFSLICAWINALVNNREAGDLRRYRTQYDVTVMTILVLNHAVILNFLQYRSIRFLSIKCMPPFVEVTHGDFAYNMAHESTCQKTVPHDMPTAVWAHALLPSSHEYYLRVCVPFVSMCICLAVHVAGLFFSHIYTFVCICVCVFVCVSVCVWIHRQKSFKSLAPVRLYGNHQMWNAIFRQPNVVAWWKFAWMYPIRSSLRKPCCLKYNRCNIHIFIT